MRFLVWIIMLILWGCVMNVNYFYRSYCLIVAHQVCFKNAGYDIASSAGDFDLHPLPRNPAMERRESRGACL